MFGFVEVPEHGGAVLAAGGAEGAVGGDGDGVDVAGVADVVGLDPAGGEFPDLVGGEIGEQSGTCVWVCGYGFWGGGERVCF